MGKIELTGSVLYPSGAELEFGERRIRKEATGSTIFLRGGLTFSEAGLPVAKVRALSKLAHAPDAIAFRSDMPTELRMMLFHLSRLN